jgi:hypothetical protein
MALPDIYHAFQAAAQAGELTGDSPEGLADLLGRLNTPQLAVQNGEANLGPDSAWLTGTTSFLNTTWSFTLTGRESSDPNRAALTLAMTLAPQATPWTFAQAFPGDQLPQSRRVTPASPDRLVLGPSVIAPLVLGQPAIQASNDPRDPRPHLQGWLNLLGDAKAPGSDLLSYYAGFLGSPLWLDGTFDRTNPTQPVLRLDAIASGASGNFGKLTLTEIGIRLSSDYPDPSPLPAEGAPTSAALLFGRLAIPSVPPDVVDISGPLLTGDNVWPLFVAFDDPLGLQGGIQALMSLMDIGDPSAFALPPGIAPINEFGLSQLEFGVIPPDKGGPGVTYSAVTIVSKRPWDPPIPFLIINQVGTRWNVDWGGEQPLITGSVWGTMTFGQKRGASHGAMMPYVHRLAADPSLALASNVTVTIRLDLPEMAFVVYNEEPIDIPISQGIAAFFNTPAPDIPAHLTIDSFNVYASYLRKTYAAGLTISGGNWEVSAGPVVFRLDTMELQIAVTQSQVSGLILGVASIDVPGSKSPVKLMVSAEYPGDGHWTFEGAIFGGPLNLVRFVAAFLAGTPPQWVNELAINLVDFYVRYNTGPGKPFLVRGTLEIDVKEELLGIPMNLRLSGEIERKLKQSTADHVLALALRDPDPETVVIGKLAGAFTLNRFAVTAAVTFQEAQKTYAFSVAYKDLTLTATSSTDKTGGTPHQVLTLRLTGATLGSVVEYLISLANPNANYRLDPPWDFLNSIDLGRFALIIDPTLQVVTMTYDLNLNLAFITIDSVGLRYDRSTATPSVKFVIKGTPLGDTSPKTLEWDPVTQGPPPVPGKGQNLFNLRYLGLGQHVGIKGLTDYTSIADVIDALVKDMRPITDPRKVPIDPAKMYFDPSSQWMIGLDCTVMDTVALQLVLHDPDLYGILVALKGSKAGSLAGLSIELLYKKVTADIGVFHVRLQIPDAFRQIMLGPVSVTLGIITVDIFTNGNFKVDFGFPHNADFSVSFAVEAGIFNGRGGIYFGLLNGSTSSRVPQITNGVFSPVIELGVGLAIGVGRTFQKGPLNAGLYVNLVVIFEGALAWFHPTGGEGSTELYYWCSGSVGIIGKIYGSIDFKIISVSVSLEIKAIATLTLTAYRAGLVELSVQVTASATVKFLFFSVSFHFELKLSTSFQIGQDSPAPWTLASGQSGRGQLAVIGNAFAPARRRPADVAAVTRAAYQRVRFGRSPLLVAESGLRITTVEDTGDSYHLHFDKDAKVFPDGVPHTATLKLTPAFTVAAVPVNWSGDGQIPPNPNPEYRISVMLVADNAVPPDPASIAETHRATVALNAHAATPADTSFNQIAEGMLRWSINALGIPSPTATVTLGQLEELVDQLADVQAANTGFTWENLAGFLTNNLHLLLSGSPLSGNGGVQGGTPFPMIPPLQWTSPDLPVIDQRQRQFWQYQPVDATYESEALAYFQKLDPRPTDHQPDPLARLAAGGDAIESMATFVFRDYFLMVARTTVQAAVNLLSAFPHTVSGTDSLASIASSFPTTTVDYRVIADDSVDHVAEVFGMSASELVALNPTIAAQLAGAHPGDLLLITLGVTPESIASANPTWPVASGATVHLGTLSVQVQTGDTFTAIGGRYGIDVTSWLDLPGTRDAKPLLRPGAAIQLTAFIYPNPVGLSVDLVAAVYFVRLPMTSFETIPLAEWYAEAIVQLNPNDTIPTHGPLPATLTVPTAYLDLTHTQQWTTLPGDTLEDVAAYLALAQNVAAGSTFDTWRQAVRAANTTPPPAGVALPATAVLTILPDDTLTLLETRLLLDDSKPDQAATFRALVQGADILQPLASVTVPGAVITAGQNLTLVTLAQAYGLSLEDLAARMAGDAGVLATDANRELIVPNVSAIALADLTTALHAPKQMAGISGEVSRFMLYGLRLPAPVFDGSVYHATGPMTGSYELIGQQVTGPPPVSPVTGDDPEPPVVTITVSAGQAVDWLSFADSIAVSPDDRLAALSDRHPDLSSLNPAIHHRASELRAADAESNQDLPAGMIVLTALADSAVLSLTNDQLVANYPATGLVPALQGTITPLPLFREIAVQHPLTQMIPWQTTDAPLLPSVDPIPPSQVAFSLWPLSAELMAKAADGESVSQYLVEQSTPQAGPDGPSTELSAYSWGMLIGLNVRRIPGLPGTVEVLGADTADRQRLALLIEYLGVVDGLRGTAEFSPAPAGEEASIKLLWQLPPTPGARPGLTSLPLLAHSTFVIQTNLSTETRSGALSRAQTANDDPTAGKHFASIADAARFLTLLWECSVVGGGGYWLHYEGNGSEVPESIFDQDGLGQFSVLIQLASQSTIDAGKSWPVRRLFAFNTCAVIGDGIDPGSVALAAIAKDPVELRREASVLPGQVGFTLDLTNPGPAPGTKEGMLQQLYSLVGYQLVPSLAFAGSTEGRPIGPQVKSTTNENGEDEQDEQTWNLARVIPIDSYAREHLPQLPTCPSSMDDPYAGINGSDTTPPQPVSTEVGLWFHDVLGNASLQPDSAASAAGALPPGGRLPLPVQYTDPVIAVSAWPSTTTHYAVETRGSGADAATYLVAGADLQSVVYQPSASQGGAATANRASRDAACFAAAYYQIMQPDVDASLLSSLQQAPGAEPTPLPVPIDRLRAYVIGAHALLSSIAAFGDYLPDPSATPTLDDLCLHDGIDYDSIGAANASVAIDVMLTGSDGGVTLQVPQIVTFQTGNTVKALCDAAKPGPDPAIVLQDQDNIILPLTTGVELRTPARTVPVPDPSPSVEEWLRSLNCTLATLVDANKDTPGLLTPGFTFECNGVKVGVAPTAPQSETTLTLIAQTFKGLGVPYDAAQIVALNATTPGMFRAGASVGIDGYISRPADTLKHNQATLTPAQLAPLNTTTVNLFPPGTPLFLQTLPVVVPAGQTLGAFAADQKVIPGTLLRHNGSATLAPASQLAVPGLYRWPVETTTIRVPYIIRAGDRLADIAGYFLPAPGDPGDSAALALARLNLLMPGTIAQGATITIGGQSITTAHPESFQSACALFHPAASLDALVSAIEWTAGILAEGALLVCPPGILPAPVTGQPGVAPRDAAARFGLDPGALLGANAGTPDLLVAGQTVRAWTPTNGDPPPTETIAAGDSLTAIIQRFARRGDATSIQTLVAANGTVPFLRPGATVLLPATTSVSAQLGAKQDGGSTTWTFPGTIFPIHAWLEISRDYNLVDPDLRGPAENPSAAVRARTALPASRSAQSKQGDALTLAEFARRLESAIPVLRVATGQVLAEQEDVSGTDVWAVLFTSGGIEQVRAFPPLTVPGTTSPQPRTFALRPLVNTLIARQNVTTKILDVKTGTWIPGKTETRNYQGIDLEVWARSFLADMDLILSPAYVTGAYALNRPALDEIVDTKKRLAASVAAGLEYILDGEAPPPGSVDPKRTAAVEALCQQLLVSLAGGYATSAVLQYDTEVTSSWPAPLSSSTPPYARLSGNPVANFASTDPSLKTASISNGKISLASGSSQMSLLLTVPDVEAHASLAMALTYKVVELEFGIAPVIEGYEKSDWLSFVLPIGTGQPPALQIDLGSPDVPLPLRAYPPLPTLVDHRAAVPSTATQLEDALHWRYEFLLRHQSAEQDALWFEVTFNEGATLGADALSADDLFGALAQYNAAAAPLLGILSGLTDWKKAGQDQQGVLKTALSTYCALASAVESAWNAHWTPTATLTVPSTADNPALAPDVYEFSMALETDASAQRYTLLRLTRTAHTGTGDVGWPDISCITADGESHPLHPVPSEQCDCPPGAMCQCYSFEGDVPAFALLTFDFLFPRVHIAEYQDATARAWVKRNAQLLGPEGPDTVDAFVYQTPDVSYSQPVVPFIDITDRILIGGWPLDPSVHNPLVPMFASIFADQPADRTIGVGVRYGYQLAPGDPPLEAYLPVKQSTVGPYDQTATVPEITAALTTWKKDNDPATIGGGWAFWVSLYSGLDPSLQRPVLQLKRLVSELE